MDKDQLPDTGDVEINVGEVKAESGSSVNVAGRDIFQNITNIFQSDTSQQRAYRNRQNMLQLVWNTWIEGVLRKSLYNEILIELGMETRQDAIEHPWDIVLHMPEQLDQVLPAQTKIIDVFDQANGSLLVLGEPGSGKTTMLLELARQAIERAREIPTQPIPVIFNLSSWNDPRKIIYNWLVDEFREKYYINTKISQAWIENEELLLIMDGLDEVKIEYRDECIKAINDFNQQYGMPLVVSSRSGDYEVIATRLQLHGAVFLKALSRQQVEEYFQRQDIHLDAVRQVWESSVGLQELINSPLMLSVMTIAFQNSAKEELSTSFSPKFLFDTYIDRMFERIARNKKSDFYPRNQSIKWLGFLASQMMKNGQTLFLGETIDQSWLQKKNQRKIYYTITRVILGIWGGIFSWILGGLILGTIFLISHFLSLESLFDLQFYLVLILFLGFPMLFIPGFFSGFISFKRRYKVTTRFYWDWNRVKNGFTGGFIYGFLAGMISQFGFITCLIFFNTLVGGDIGIVIGVVLFLAILLFGGFIKWPIGKLGFKKIELAIEPKDRNSRQKIVAWLIGGLIAGFIFLALLVRFSKLEGSAELTLLGCLPSWIISGLCGGFLVGLGLGFYSGLQTPKVASDNFPGEFIRSALLSTASASIILFVGLEAIITLGLVIFVGLLSTKVDSSGIIALQFFSLGFASMYGLSYANSDYGGCFLVSYFTLRFLLYRSKFLPKYLFKFLEYSTQHLFLRRVGGGYIFVHRMLMEHFAAIWEEKCAQDKI
jgi:eukaryotic-like serine/threonine-protein kinase